MLIAVYFFITNTVIPQFATYANALLEPLMVIVITLAGIVMLFSAVGVRISNNLGSTVVGGVFRAIAYLGRTLIQAIAWIIRNAIRVTPMVFIGSRRTFNSLGLTPIVSNILAVLVTITFVIVII